MTPDGEIYFHESEYREDFSIAQPIDKNWFMHEMVHVWQYQLGYPVALRGAIRFGLNYTYFLKRGKKLSDFNMVYEEVINEFLKNRKSKTNLPGNDIDHEPLFDMP